MRLLTCLCIALLTAISVKAQQKPHYTQYMLNNYIINPAITGIENYTDVKVSHRHQWVGLQDAPVTTYLTVHTPLGKKDDRATMNSYDVTSNINPMGKRYWDDYTASEPHHGIGLQIVNDRIGPFNTFSAMATYAYHLGLSAKTNISAGVGVGFNNISINQQKTFFGADFPIDPALSNSREFGRYRLDVSAGVYLYSADYYVGIGAQQLVPQNIQFTETGVNIGDGKLIPHLFLTAGYRFLLSEDVNLVPSILIKKVNPLPTQVDINLKAQYHNLFWAGVNYRMQYGFSAFAGLTISRGIGVSYAYDYSTTRINTISSGTHEILVGFAIPDNRQRDTCPKNVW